MISTIKTNCPRDCYDGCGILVEKRSDGRHRIVGDPDHPIAKGKLCSKCALAYNGVWQDPTKRLLHPMKRVGLKGTGNFLPISWEEALAEIAKKMQKAIADSDSRSILHTHYSGTLSLMGYAFPNRFFNYLGATEVEPDTICNAAGHVAWELLFGNSIFGFDPRTIKQSNSIIVWGANPSHSAPHIQENWLGKFSGKVIVVDPVKTLTAKSADLHLQPNPGSDAALAFSILNCLDRAGKLDKPFIEKCTIGYEEIEENIQISTPEWGEKMTGVPADIIQETANIYGDGPSLLWCGQGLQRQRRGGNIMRAIGLLPALTGNIGKPGTGFYYLNITPAVAGLDFDWLKGVEENSQKGLTISHMELANELGDPEKFKVFFSWNTNPLASAPEQSMLRQNLKREDLFTVVCDLFMTDTAKFADIILPAASFLEFDDITFSYFNYYIGAQSKVSEPMGHSLPNAEIFRRLAKEMGIKKASLYESDQSLIDNMLRQMKLDINFNDLKQKGFIYLENKTIIPYESREFQTASGKIEIVSQKAESIGLPRTPLPTFDPPIQKDHWRLLTPASFWRMNDSYSNETSIVKKTGSAKVYMNTLDAASLSISEGDIVELYNDVGSLELEVALDDTILSQTIVSYKGRWPSLESTLQNVNFLHQARPADMGDSSSVHSTLVQIRTNCIKPNSPRTRP